VIHTGIAEVRLGGTVTYGALLTAGPPGTAVAAVRRRGQRHDRGRALSAGGGDFIDALITGPVQG
jgi:threonine/homoserine/homoserine lactone efflux protein